MAQWAEHWHQLGSELQGWIKAEFFCFVFHVFPISVKPVVRDLYKVDFTYNKLSLKNEFLFTMKACQIPISNHTNFDAYNVRDSDIINAAERIFYT